MPVGPIHRDAPSAPFFDAAAQGQLVIRRCTGCGHAWSPHIESCAECGSAELTWASAAGTGTIVSWTTVHRRGAADQPPDRTVVGLVELDEGPWLDGELVDVEPEDLAVGRAVRVRFLSPPDSEAVPAFSPL